MASAGNMSTRHTAAVVCTPGLEFATSNELDRLGIKVDRRGGRSRSAPGLVECRLSYEQLCRVNLYARTASRVLLRLGSFDASSFEELCAEVEKLPWNAYVKPGTPVSVRVATVKSRLYHKRGIAERVAASLSKKLGAESTLCNATTGDDDGFVQQIVVRIVRNICSVSIDSSGEHLHRRGYRLQTAKAPLRENVAAALLIAAGWRTDRPLIDPFCGSGTIPIEAAMMAARKAPGINRRFAFQEWPDYDAAAWTRLCEEARGQETVDVPPITGSDRDAGAVEASRSNAERAGVDRMIEWHVRSISDLTVPESPGWVVTNPPYGQRVTGGPDLRNLYARMGTVWRSLLPAWQVYVVTSSPRWVGQLGVGAASHASFNNGGIPVKFYRIKELDQAHDGT